MFEKTYKTKNLFIASLGLLKDREYSFDGEISHCKFLDEVIIVKKVSNNLYSDIFTKTNISTLSNKIDCGEIFLFRSCSINKCLTDKELSTGKITKSRLIELYRILNRKKDEYDDNYENYQDGTNGKVIKFAKKRNKK